MTPDELAAALRALPCEQLWSALNAAKILKEWEYVDNDGRATCDEDEDEEEEPAWARSSEMCMRDLSGRCVARAWPRYPDRHWYIVVDGAVVSTLVLPYDDPRPVAEAAAEAEGWRMPWRGGGR